MAVCVACGAVYSGNAVCVIPTSWQEIYRSVRFIAERVQQVLAHLLSRLSLQLFDQLAYLSHTRHVMQMAGLYIKLLFLILLQYRLKMVAFVGRNMSSMIDKCTLWHLWFF